MHFYQIDPRPQGREANEKFFAEHKAVLGIELTVKEWADQCSCGNIDPQHSHREEDPAISMGWWGFGSSDYSQKAAIEVALMVRDGYEGIPFDPEALVTVRADLDSIGTMAVLAIRIENDGGVYPYRFSGEALMRIYSIARSDAWSRGEWQGKPLPTSGNPFPEEGGELSAMAAAVADFRIPLDQRVEWMKKWLLTGEEPEGYREKVEAERLDMVWALEDGTIKFQLSEQRVAIVESVHRSATSVGYSVSPVMVALNPEFRFSGGEPHRKFTVCQHCEGWVDIQKVKEDLLVLEDGWGGSITILGSPQGVSSKLDISTVVEIVEKHLLKII